MAESPEARRERRLSARADRQRVAAEGRKRAAQQRRLALAAAVTLGVVLVLAIGYFVSQTAFRPTPGQARPDEGRDHVAAGTPIDYKNNPPSSGSHYGTWTRSGVYTESQEPGYWVHSLEHGYVVILYNCATPCPELVDQLRQFYDSAPPSRRWGYPKLVIVPYTNMDSKVAAVAWNRVDTMDQLDLERLSAFYRAYLDKGPEEAG